MRLGGQALSFVLLPTSSMPSAGEFRAAWQEVGNESELPVQRAWDATSAEVEFGGIRTIATLMPLAVPNGEAEAAAAQSLSSMRAKGFSPAPHVAHLAVVSTSPSHPPLERLLRHTRVVAALARAGRATGVYEGNAHATHDPEFYLSAVTDGPELPLMLWNGISIATTPDSVELLTLGMAQLELPDLLLVAPAGHGNDALSFVFELLAYVVSRGEAIPEGETVGRTATEKLPVTYVPSPIDPASRVMKVQLPQARKRWWPFGKN